VLTNLTQFDFGRKWLLEATTEESDNDDDSKKKSKEKGDDDKTDVGEEKGGDKAADKGKGGDEHDSSKSSSSSVSKYKCLCLPKYKRMNVRDAPSKDAKPTGNFIFHGEMVEVMESKDGWLRHSKGGWTAEQWAGEQVMFQYHMHFTMLISFTSSLNPIRRLATFQTIRNCALDQKLIHKVQTTANDLIERLLLPLVVSTPYEDHEKKGMPQKVRVKNDVLVANLKVRPHPSRDNANHDNNSAQLEETAVKKAILETFIQFARNEKMRRLLDSYRTYVVLRELHKVEEVEELGDLITHVQNMFILDKQCLQQPRPVIEGKAGVRVENEVWTSPTGPKWDGPVPQVEDAAAAAAAAAAKTAEAKTAEASPKSSKE